MSGFGLLGLELGVSANLESSSPYSLCGARKGVSFRHFGHSKVSFSEADGFSEHAWGLGSGYRNNDRCAMRLLGTLNLKPRHPNY